ncbi:HIRA-interacting protein 5 [Choiromyces venosus 120613-1]|uniref:HIRA-interacting protein 5 n=1 Tax=Choiromyces venosus 120613-1 TaxID=1336337 RepID=A0A3N4JLQ7_9PEZI|nr:HIRA-interacting protein 5 [Choiromyces venosus 120613-1]
MSSRALLTRLFLQFRPRFVLLPPVHQQFHTLYRPTVPRTTHILRTPKRTLFIQTETTPNPSALKFIPGLPVLPEGCPSQEYIDGRETHNSPLARKLFAVDGVRSVFYGPDFITITKDEETQWAFLKAEVYSLITEALNSGEPVVLEGTMESSDTKREEGDSEVVGMIKELLETRIRPAIQEDGGDIEYRGFENGTVKLKLRGACRTCDSSTVTLKNGIESMLMHYIEEVQSVEQIMDPEEEVAVREFEKFEEKLKKVKGPEAIASTGKGELDSAEA